MDSKEVFNQVKEKIDAITYTEELKFEPVSDIITIGWESAIPEPPANSSDHTLDELEYLSKLTKNLTYKEKKLVELVDDDPMNLFSSIPNHTPITKKEWKQLWNTTRPVVMNLKYKFNRPRPAQLAPLFGLEINVTETDTHHTPAYPSGHTFYTAMAAHLLADKNPELSGEFFRQVGVAGYARCLQGVHYPSDNDAAMALSGVVWEDVRLKLRG
jgi:acid phosphatase (class A)